MNIFKIHKDIRRVGLNFGVPAVFIECGIGVNYSLEDLLQKLSGMGLRKGSLFVIRDGMDQKGISTLATALKQANMRVEVEATTRDVTPKWLPEVTYWVVKWLPGGGFNHMALRPRQDILLFEGLDATDFLEGTREVLCEKGIISDEPLSVDLLYAYNVRLYGKDSKEC